MYFYTSFFFVQGVAKFWWTNVWKLGFKFTVDACFLALNKQKIKKSSASNISLQSLKCRVRLPELRKFKWRRIICNIYGIQQWKCNHKWFSEKVPRSLWRQQRQRITSYSWDDWNDVVEITSTVAEQQNLHRQRKSNYAKIQFGYKYLFFMRWLCNLERNKYYCATCNVRFYSNTSIATCLFCCALGCLYEQLVYMMNNLSS